jgi:fatty-acyl-CoA synthase
MTNWYDATDCTWIDIFTEQTERFRDRVYAVSGEEELTYGDLRDRVDRLATGLLRTGVRPGQTVAIWMTSCLEFLVCQWAIYRAGCTLLPLYSYYKESELEHGLADARPTLLFTKADFAGKVDARGVLLNLLPELAANDCEGFSRAPSLRHVVTLENWNVPAAEPLETVMQRGTPSSDAGLNFAAGRTTTFDVMNVMYTSGTTGVPKGGLSMHRNNLATIHLWSERAHLGSDDVILCHVPLFTNFGGLYGSGLAMYNGCKLILTETFDAAHSLELIEAWRVSYIPGTPEMFRMLLDDNRFAQTDVTSVRGAHVAGSYCSPELMGRIIEDLAPQAMQAYGMSENGGLSTVTAAGDPWDVRLHSVGRPLANSLVQIRDPSTGDSVENGELGEIWFGDARPGSCVGKGYLGAPEETAAAITPEGWFRSGDIGRFDERGYLYFTGRLKNMITVGGFNVYPREIEEFLQSLPGVRSAHVVGAPDDRLGSVPVAFVVPEAADVEAEQLLARARERLSSQKQPRDVWLVAADDLPLNPTGKVNLARLEEWAAQRR